MERLAATKGGWRKVAGAIFLGTGVLLLLASGAYYGYGVLAKAKIGEFAYVSERPSVNVQEQLNENPRASVAAVSVAIQSPRDIAEGPDRITGQVRYGREQGETRQQPSDVAATVEGEGQASPYEVFGIDADPYVQPSDSIDANTTVRMPTPDQGGEGQISQGLGVGLAEVPASGALGRKASSGDVPESTGLGSPAVNRYGRANDADELLRSSSASGARFSHLRAELPEYPVSESLALSIDVGPATRISIPAIRVSSAVEDLDLVLGSDGLAWETPKNVVGHIPDTADPGQGGQGWYFGHLESPIRNEGKVFSKLPEIPRLLKRGEEVQIIFESDDRRYVYQVYHTAVVPQEELVLTNSGLDEITLVTCWPRLIYDHRLIVTAALISTTEL